MIQTSPLWLNYKQLNLNVYNIVREYVCVFWENHQIQISASKNGCCFLRCDETLRVDPTFWF